MPLMPLADQLRALIRDSGKSANQVAEEAGLSQPTVTRFLNGKDLYLENAEKLMAYFGLVVMTTKTKKPKRK
jgi:transcriptional regulator with XRE-family HTH domain